MRLYNRVTGKQTQWDKIGELKGPHQLEPEPFNPREREQAFKGAYRSYRVHRRSRMDVETFFHRIRGDLINLTRRELTDLEFSQDTNDYMDQVHKG